MYKRSINCTELDMALLFCICEEVKTNPRGKLNNKKKIDIRVHFTVISSAADRIMTFFYSPHSVYLLRLPMYATCSTKCAIPC